MPELICSRAAQQLDEQLAEWRSCRLSKTRYLYLDPGYEKMHDSHCLAARLAKARTDVAELFA